ncbi:MAG TPA: alpha-E domain-containing protein [Bryobacteraceae bacterium]|nr:alpha-E domain-containing protein [Bryobacteraceae bacterium]
MLSRVADSLYWTSRYLERAEHSARLIDVHLNMMIDQSFLSSDQRWRQVAASLGTPLADDSTLDAHSIARALTFDPTNRSSIVSCITAARENARQVREQISSEMWHQLNRLFHQVRRPGTEEAWSSQPLEFLYAVREGAHLFQGLTDSTMSHGEGWHFIQVGRFLERANATATLLDVHFSEHSLNPDELAGHLEYIEWIALLKSCTAFEAYCKVYTAELRPVRIAEFLMLNPEFPHSLRFAADMLHTALDAVAEASPTRKAGRVEKLTGKMRASLSFSHIEEILSGGIHPYLTNIQRQCSQMHSAVNQVYITYPIQSALEA